MDLSQAPVTLLLLIVNVLVSGYALFGDPSLIGKLALVPRRVIENGEYQRLITGGFVHAGLAHLAFNMITLFFFGPILEGILGPAKFLLVYFGAELGAHVLSLVMHRHDPRYAAVGASGAISGVLFGFCLFQPLAMLGVFFVIPMPAIVFAVLYVVISVYAMRGGEGERGGIAHEAHLGGAVAGLVLTAVLEPRALPIFLNQIGL